MAFRLLFYNWAGVNRLTIEGAFRVWITRTADRVSTVCPLCQGHKEVGSVVCRPCYRARSLRDGDAGVAGVPASVFSCFLGSLLGFAGALDAQLNNHGRILGGTDRVGRAAQVDIGLLPEAEAEGSEMPRGTRTGPTAAAR